MMSPIIIPIKTALTDNTNDIQSNSSEEPLAKIGIQIEPFMNINTNDNNEEHVVMAIDNGISALKKKHQKLDIPPPGQVPIINKAVATDGSKCSINPTPTAANGNIIY